MRDLIKRLRWRNIAITLVGIVILGGVGMVVVLLAGKHNSKTVPPPLTSSSSKQSPASKPGSDWVEVPPTTKSIDQSPKQTAIDANGNVLDHSKDFMTYYTSSPEGVAVASSFDLLASAGHTVLHTPVQSGADLSANTDVQSHWVGGGKYSNLGGLNQSMVKTINELDSVSVKIERIGLLWPNYTLPKMSTKGVPYTLTVTSALFKATGKDGATHYFIVKIQNEVDKPISSTTFSIHPVAMQVVQLYKVDEQSNQSALKNYFVQPN